MWELICHHTYKWNGRPVDLSFYDNLADANAPFLADGIAPGSGALRFVQHGNRVRVASGPAWNPLVALRLEITARLTEPSQARQTLIEGDKSFGLFVSGQALFFYFYGKSIIPGGTSDSVNTYKDGLAFPGYRLPFGKWVTIAAVHTGFDEMRLYVDGEPVTFARSALSAIGPVGPKGVTIGNGLDGGTIFGGDIDEAKVWRRDPNAWRATFLDRPQSPAEIECWERFFRAWREALAAHPDCAKRLASGFSGALDDLRRAIAAKGPETRERFAKVCKEFADLWRSGRIDGPEMKTLLADWCAWLRLVGLSPESDPRFAALFGSSCWTEIVSCLPGLDCDPRLMALVRLAGTACGGKPARRTGGGRRPATSA
jgi:concanavalin A-like lectin/glucanase superfamily protein